MSANNLLEHYKAQRLALAQKPTNADWLTSFTENLAQRVEAYGLPTRQNEAWKYTRLDALAKHEWPAARKQAIAALPSSVAESHKVALVNGMLDEAHSTIADLPTGVTICPLTQHPQCETIKEKVITHYTHNQPKFFKACSLFEIEHSLVISVDANTVCERPLHLHNLLHADETASSHPNVIILLGENAAATVVESFHANEQQHFTNQVVTIAVEKNADLTYIKCANIASQTHCVTSHEVMVARDARFNAHSLTQGAGLVRFEWNVALNEPNAFASINGLFRGLGKGQLDNPILIKHKAANTQSVVNYRGILDDSSIGVFNGKVKVYPDAQNICAQMQNNNLLLSERAEIDTKPVLEIYADDVKCSHGTTVGELDEDALFFLMSRGIDYDTARAMLVDAFAHSIYDTLFDSTIRQWLENDYAN